MERLLIGVAPEEPKVLCPQCGKDWTDEIAEGLPGWRHEFARWGFYCADCKPEQTYNERGVVIRQYWDGKALPTSFSEDAHRSRGALPARPETLIPALAEAGHQFTPWQSVNQEWDLPVGEGVVAWVCHCRNCLTTLFVMSGGWWNFPESLHQQSCQETCDLRLTRVKARPPGAFV